jgi:hypothetical protein
VTKPAGEEEMAQIESGLTVTFDVGGQAIPLESPPIQPQDGQSLKEAIQQALEQGLEFSLPPGQSVEVPLAEFITWLGTRSLVLPAGLEEIIGGTTITITGFTASTSGKFNTVLKVEFAEGAIPANFLGDLINAQELGLRLAYDPS